MVNASSERQHTIYYCLPDSLQHAYGPCVHAAPMGQEPTCRGWPAQCRCGLGVHSLQGRVAPSLLAPGRAQGAGSTACRGTGAVPGATLTRYPASKRASTVTMPLPPTAPASGVPPAAPEQAHALLQAPPDGHAHAHDLGNVLEFSCIHAQKRLQLRYSRFLFCCIGLLM